uniref:Uncharacterized protein n=1 Tax=Daphnia galeata TaxID=27404 RepID=A0A8J2RZ28_9CRUS|nr:unnamed protein product [Daphnia galeata]
MVLITQTLKIQLCKYLLLQVLFVAICVTVFPELSANPVENEEQAIVMRNENNEKRWTISITTGIEFS